MINKLLKAYLELCTWCDDIFSSAASSSPGLITCHRGCSSCCTIETVTRLEALAIVRLSSSPLRTGSAIGHFCSFLDGGACAIYDIRPLICRTHGLLMHDSESGNMRPTCHMSINESLLDGQNMPTFDAVKISENLLRLNLAMMRILGLPNERALDRIDLADVAEQIAARKWPLTVYE